MRTVYLLLSAFFILPVHADQDCQPEHLSLEDLAIMASVRAPQADSEAVAQSGPVLYGVATDRGQLSPEDIAIIQSVQPVGARVVLCPSNQAVLN